MRIEEAVRWHATLANALVCLWTSAPNMHQILHNYLGEWEHQDAKGEDEYLHDLAQHLKMRRAPNALIEAVTAVTIDGYQALDAMFGVLVDKVKAEYEALSSWGVDDDVKLIKAFQTDPVFPDPAPYGALGATACVLPRPGSGGMPSSTVKLTFVPALLGPPTWASVPSLLCHELVAHINQAAPMASTDPFGEGWMDVVAQRYHQVWIGDLFPQCPEFAIRSAAELGTLTSQRYPGLKAISDKTRAVRMTGSLVASQVNAQLTALVRAEGRTPDREFERISLQLNRVPTSAAKREAFVYAVIGALNGLDGRAARRWGECLASWLRDEATPSEVLSFS
jgi:hypothetical protein